MEEGCTKEGGGLVDRGGGLGRRRGGLMLKMPTASVIIDERREEEK